MSTGVGETIDGDEDDNVLNGTSGDDTISGYGGNDTINGYCGNDILDGGEGDDTIEGGDGDDTIRGGSGINTLNGGIGNDKIFGEWYSGNTINAGSGDDIITVVDSTDTVDGGDGNDILRVYWANLQTSTATKVETLEAGYVSATAAFLSGFDTIRGHADYAGFETIYLHLNGAGDAVLNIQSGVGGEIWGSAHNNGIDFSSATQAFAIYAGKGDDIVKAGAGDDIIYGGDGLDTLVLDGARTDYEIVIGDDGHVTITDLREGSPGGTDEIYNVELAQFSDGSEGLDGSIGSNFDDILVGTEGDDSLYGFGGNDSLRGLGGADTLDGGKDDDKVEGSAGDDVLIAGDGNDILIGGSGNDTFRVEASGTPEEGDKVLIKDIGGTDTIDASKARSGVTLDLTTGGVVDGRSVEFESGAFSGEAKPLDLMFVQDLSGSYGDDISTVRTFLPDLLNLVLASNTNAHFGLSSFVDKPVYPFGSSGDYVYRTDLALTNDAADFLDTYRNLAILGGNDTEESQLEALMQVALRTVEVGWRPGANKVAILFTDAPPHIAGDGAAGGITVANNGDAVLNGTIPGTGEDYPAIAQVAAALLAAGIIPVFAVTEGVASAYEEFVETLGAGAVLDLSSDSANALAVINSALGFLEGDGYIENAVGSDFADTLKGNRLDNRLEGGAGADTLDGDAGNDTLVGGAGNDTLKGGLGSDKAVYSGDIVDYLVTVNSNGSKTVKDLRGGSPDGTDTLTGIEILQFNDGTLGSSSAPENVTLSGHVLTPKAVAGTVVGTLSAHDVDGDAISFSLTSDSSALFEIVGNQLRLKTNANLDPLATPVLTIIITATDIAGLTASKAFEININQPPEGLALSKATVAENVAVGTEVGALSATDPEGGALSYSLTDNAGGLFKLSGNKLVTAKVINFETTPSDTVAVQVSDAAGNKISKTFTINVTNVNEAPTGLGLSKATVAENVAVGTEVGALSATDPEGGALSYSLTDNAGGLFKLSGNKLVTAKVINFETTPSDTVAVQVSDAAGNKISKTFTINVTNVNEAPTGLGLSKATVAENVAVGTEVGALSATDPEGGALSYSLTDSAGGLFKLSGNKLVTAKAINFETTPSDTVAVQVSDAAGNKISKTFTINVTNANEAPTGLGLSKATVAENVAVGTEVGALSATDPEGGALSYSLTDSAGGLFKLSGNKLVTAKAINFETTPSDTVTVQVSDAAGNKISKTFTINVTNVNEAPTGLGLSKATVAENVAVGTEVGALSATDPEGGALSYSLTDNAGGLFKLSGNKLVTAKVINFETTPSDTVAVQVSDAAGNKISKTFTINVTNVNEAPTGLGLSKATVAENVAVGTEVGALSATDPEGGALSYSLTDSAGGLFKLSGNKLVTAKAINFETTPSDTVAVQVSDAAGNKISKTFTINVTNANEAPTGLGLSKATVAENVAVGTEVGALSATDPEGGALSYSLTDSAGGLFKLSGNKLVTAKAINFETTPSDTVTVQVSDAAGNKISKTFTINVTNVNEAPTGLGLSKATVAENVAVGTEVGALSATDPEGGALSYSLTDNAGGLFKLSGNKLVTAKVINFETTPSDTVAVQVSDAAGNKISKTFTINVTNVNEAPTGLGLSKATVAENVAVGTEVGALSATDPEGGALSYSLTDSAGGLFKLSGNKLVTAKAINFETTPSDTVTVQVSDAAGNKISKTFTINVTNLDEGPANIKLSHTNVDENVNIGTTVGTFSTAEPESRTQVYSLTDDAGGLFTLLGNKLVTANSVNYETLQSDTITVQVVDKNGEKTTKTFTITVNDLLETVNGTFRSETLKGGIGKDKIVAGAGNDTLQGGDGNDQLFGDIGNDTLYGGKGADHLTGGVGADIFVFKALSDTMVSATSRDTVLDFNAGQGDRIDISAFDANTQLSGDQAFSFIGTKAFAGKAGELRYEKTTSDTYIYGDVNGDKKADFAIHLDDAVTLDKGYFLL
ncbi:Ca2+-binding RTX toxin-like protein/predicted transcriptional regulator [Pararhizobium capsulatum DSM 1112]|uniref:Ca2+-binding RTX toxin-like protein/predicted transcriptional regulator n=1 Tax=Pararhizobium capsulatum DSM 1112 TaxID=1121113 RepID=A0ABU0BL59_9HYPH|nr:Ig-like domain-containing protein [Pararhizobium capsulatum]MDQ0318474.1 Ca2+-binding RTX toxin-like protein/predicted transcriptional regulator [Pararhizobium capsulatum DSM 1112]